MAGELADRAKQIQRKLVDIRRTIHKHPELAFEEKKTSELVVKTLRRVGLKVKSGVAKTGVVGLIEGRLPGPTVAIRADMDALNITEESDVPYRSTVDGKMHACGHDGHVAAAIGAAMLLEGRRFQLPGKVKFIFQPGEEKIPGGAKPMIEAGVLKRPKVEVIFSLHSDPMIPVGKIGVRDGPLMAAADDFDIIIHGEACHGARPNLGVDAIAVAAQVIGSLQNIASRRIDPLHPVVVSVGRIAGGQRANVVADRVELNGTFRTLDRRDHRRVRKMIREVAVGVARAGGARAEVELQQGYPVLVPDPGANEIVRGAAREVLGKDGVIELPEPVMGAEDFAYFLEQVPGTMFRLGVRNTKKGIIHPWHHPKFDLDEDALWIGAAILAGAVERWLEARTARDS